MESRSEAESGLRRKMDHEETCFLTYRAVHLIPNSSKSFVESDGNIWGPMGPWGSTSSCAKGIWASSSLVRNRAECVFGQDLGWADDPRSSRSSRSAQGNLTNVVFKPCRLRHPPVITRNSWYKPFPVMGGKHGIVLHVLPTLIMPSMDWLKGEFTGKPQLFVGKSMFSG